MTFNLKMLLAMEWEKQAIEKVNVKTVVNIVQRSGLPIPTNLGFVEFKVSRPSWL